MTDHTPASQAASTNQLSDAYVNAVIQRHGYQSPETVIARLNQWIGLHGGEDSVTLLMYEAHKALSKLRAPVADERAAFEAFQRGVGLNELYLERHPESGQYRWTATKEAWETWQARAALASAPVAGEAKEDLAPPKCPITGRPFFVAIEHPELGMVPTYGGPYDSYTIPHLDGKPDQPRHERELYVYRYDHDLGGWRTDEVEVIPLRIVHEDVLHGLEDAAPQASEAVRDAAFEAVRKRLCAIPRYSFCLDDDGVVRRVEGCSGNWIEFDAAHALFDPVSVDAALSAQPGAQKDGGGDAG